MPVPYGVDDDVLLETFDDLLQHGATLPSFDQGLPLGKDVFQGKVYPVNHMESFSAFADVDRPYDPVLGRILTLPRAEELVDLFRNSMNCHFPFVVVPYGMSAELLSQQRPFLFLAILASASFMCKPLQRSLDASFRSALSQRVVFHGDKSLDILQGLLVYLAWFVASSISSHVTSGF